MDVQLTPDQQAFIQQAIESGRLDRPEDAVRQAMLLWEERERRRAEILAALEMAEAAVAWGEVRVINADTVEPTRAFAAEIKARGRKRLAAEK